MSSNLSSNLNSDLNSNLLSVKKTLPDKFHFLEVKIADSSVLDIKDKLYQRKLDGTAVEVFIDNNDNNNDNNDNNDDKNINNIRIFGRGVLEYGIASEYTVRFPEIIRELKRLNLPKGTDFPGELIVIDPKTGFESLKLVERRAQRESKIDIYCKQYPALLIILDVVKVGGKDVTQKPYLERLDSLKGSIKDWKNDNIFFIQNDTKLDWDFIEKNKLEGVVIRDANARYNKGIWKLKLVYTEDVYCKGEYNKSDSLKEFASLICYQIKDGKEVYVADVGGGFSDLERKEIQKMLDQGIMKEKPLVLEIKTLGRSSTLKFRNPVFLRIRYDKPWSQCYLN